MSEYSKNTNTENMSRKRRSQVEGNKSIIGHLSMVTDKFRGEPFPAMSNHYTPTDTEHFQANITPGVPADIGDLVLKTEMDRWQSEPLTQPIIERTEIAQLHGWDAMGEYL